MKKTIVLALILTAIAITLLDAQATLIACNTVKYTTGTKLSSNVDKVLLSLQKKTPTRNDRDYSVHVTSPDVYGHANCSVAIAESDCSSCLSTAVGDANSNCGLAIGVRVILDDCAIRYEEYAF